MTIPPPAAQLDETSAQTETKLRADKARGDQNRRHQRKAITQACPHLVRRWAQVPHPRYGNKVPHFTTWLERAPWPHDCVTAQ